MKRVRIGVLGYEDVTALDIVGPSEAFASATVDDQRAYEVVILGLTKKTFTAESGVVFKPHRSLDGKVDLDTLIIPGGCGLRNPRMNAKVVSWVRASAPHIRRVASVCTGIYGLAATGLLDGRRATTHWRFARDVAEKFPNVTLEPNALFLKDGPFYTAAGVTAGIDLALALIEEDLGAPAALAVARELVVYLKRPGGQEQFSEPLQFQIESTDKLAELASWMRSHLRNDLSVEALAERACLCPRQFTRRFTRVFQRTPAAFVEDLRLAEAQKRLATRSITIDGVAASVGFRSADAFRRAFERRFGISPTSYRRQFSRRKQ
ncbi:MAG TPA: GlxA family transcriptional regulator [Thermoanaerobaculia bacterium]|nr:GlxA family transcriptional regulator [Thermoanaerobaculia bacterium]